MSSSGHTPSHSDPRAAASSSSAGGSASTGGGSRGHFVCRPTASATTTITENHVTPIIVPSGTLRLRASASASSENRRIQWSEDVVDNEGLGRKTSKVCCIYHRPYTVGESSSDSSDSSDSDSSSDSDDDGSARPTDPSLGRSFPHSHGPHSHDHGDGNSEPENEEGDYGDHSTCSHAHLQNPRAKGKVRKYKPNAYERMPHYKPRNPNSENPGPSNS